LRSGAVRIDGWLVEYFMIMTFCIRMCCSQMYISGLLFPIPHQNLNGSISACLGKVVLEVVCRTHTLRDIIRRAFINGCSELNHVVSGIMRETSNPLPRAQLSNRQGAQYVLLKASWTNSVRRSQRSV
jgi:hypothetical protein